MQQGGIKIGYKNKRWGEEVFSLLSWFDVEKVGNANVMVVGAGALGNEVLKNLALFGIGNIVIVDFDKIEHSNLCRSVLFRSKDADRGSMKAEIAAERIKEINPRCNVSYIAGDIGTDVGLGIIKRMDVVIGCLDSRLARFIINRQCFRANKPWVDGGIENLEGNARIFMPGINCYECSLSETELNILKYRTGCPDIARINTTQGRVATTPVSSSIIGAIQTQEALKIIHGFNENSTVHPCKTLTGRLLKYDGMHLTLQNFRSANYNEDCLSHEVWEPVIKAGELNAGLSVGNTLEILKKLLNSDDFSINLMNNRLIYQLVNESTEKETDVILPESKVANYIDENNLKKGPRDRIFQKYFEDIDPDFPFPDLKLKEIGIPKLDILHVTSSSGVHYVELTGDE
jgi:molybdopterin/thiamine biosynthesis adenylyltransferase